MTSRASSRLQQSQADVVDTACRAIADVRWRWAEIKPQLQRELRAGQFRCEPVRRFQSDDGVIDVWPALEALVLKAVAIVLSRRLAIPPSCYHVAGHGGAKAAVRDAMDNLDGRRFVFRSDTRLHRAMPSTMKRATSALGCEE
jgi:hypothetical protein